MKSRIKHKEECTKIFEIEISPEDVKKAADEVYQDIKKIAKIPGFRPGFAPQDLVEKHYSKDAEEEIYKRLIPEAYKKALETHKIAPAGLPRIFNVSFKKDEPLTFEAEVDTRPAVKLGNYKGLKVRKRRISVSQEEVNEALSRLREVYAKYKDIPGPVKKGDYVVCDIEAFIEEKPVTRKNKNMWILADKNASLLGMGENLVGLEKGQNKEIDAKLPEGYPDKKYAGKEAKFKIAVNAIKEKELGTLDDAFAKNLNAENLDGLKKTIESELFARKERTLKVDMENQILEKFLKDNKFPVPSGLVGRQKEVLTRRLEAELLQKGLVKDEVLKEIKNLDLKISEDAKNKVRLYFILDDIAVKEKVKVGESDLDKRLGEIALSAGRSAEEVKKYYEEKDLLGGLAEEIKEDKVLEFLLKEAEIMEEK